MDTLKTTGDDLNKMNNPCYNPKTKTDCPRRHAGCAADCPEWAKYCEERNERYAKLNEERELDNAMKRNAIAQGDRLKRRSIRNRINNRKHGGD